MIFIDFLKYDLVICLFNKTQKLKKVKLVLVPPSALKGQTLFHFLLMRVRIRIAITSVDTEIEMRSIR